VLEVMPRGEDNCLLLTLARVTLQVFLDLSDNELITFDGVPQVCDYKHVLLCA
jgi:hypothetical protein